MARDVAAKRRRKARRSVPAARLPADKPAGGSGRFNALRWAAGAAVLAAGAVTMFERMRIRRRAKPTQALATGRGMPSTPPSAAAAAHGYETVDANVRALAIIMIVSIVLMAGGVATVFAMYAAFARHDRAVGLPMTREQQAEIVPPEPRLQADPLSEIAVLRMQQQQVLTTYGYADAAHRQPHIPVARAMQQLVGQPLDREPSAVPAENRDICHDGLCHDELCHDETCRHENYRDEICAVNGDNNPLAIWPQAASLAAGQADYLILAFTVVTLLLTVPIFVSITYFAFKYRAGRKVDRKTSENRSVLIELSWMLIPFVLTLIFFVWGARLFSQQKNPPPGALQVEAIGRQWMWKFQHPGGQSEINDLHVPVGQAVVIRMISQDVIHALYIPALRIQMDTIPGRYTQMWFKADKPGSFHLFCSEYCGTDHSEMDGTLTIMRPADYEAWLSHAASSQTLVSAGEALFQSYGCSGCHRAGSTQKAPSLAGLFGKPVPLEAGGTLVADESYIRTKILNPNTNKLAGYKQTMPAYEGKIAEDDLIRLVAYLKADANRANDKDPAHD